MNYEDCLAVADSKGLCVKEKDMYGHDGLIYGRRIAIKKSLSDTQKKCVLAEEIGHYATSSGNILDLESVLNRRQELRARAYAYDMAIGLLGIIASFEHGCKSRYETAEYLGVTESFLEDAIAHYRSKYGAYIKLDNYQINFEPVLGVMKLF